MNRTIKKAPIREQIYHILKSRIMERTYQAGSKLSIVSISKELNVSNSPVREAFSMLERDGLVEIYPNSGPSVITFSQERVSQIAQAILSMLLGSLEICRQTDRIDKLVDLLQDALKLQVEHMQGCSEQEYARFSIAFEASFIHCCQNTYITRQYSEIEDLFYLTVMYDHWYINIARSRNIIEHQQILGAIKDGDFELAKKLLAAHYNRFDSQSQVRQGEEAEA